MMTKEVNTELGVFVIKKPKAGPRNRAMMKAESATGMKTTVLLFTLLPKCVHKRPEGCDDTVPIDQILDDLETEDYDALIGALNSMINPTGISLDEDKKKSSTDLSTQESSQIAEPKNIG